MLFRSLSVLESGDMANTFPGVSAESCPQIRVDYPENSAELAVAKLDDSITGVKEVTKGIVTKLEVKKE